MRNKTILLILPLIFSTFLFAENEKGLTCKPIDDGNFSVAGKALIYTPKVEKTAKIETKFQKENRQIINSIELDCFVRSGEYFGAVYSSSSNSLNMLTNQEDLISESISAIEKSPAWLRADLKNILSQLTNSQQQIWAEIINSAEDPYIDEIAFTVAHSSPQYLASEYSFPELMIENAQLVYGIDEDLDYVEIVDYGSCQTDENYYSTTRYWKINENEELVQVEVPKEIYYWYLVHPKITDEIPAYIDPDIVESNSSHNNNIVSPPDGVFWRDYLYNHNDDGYPKLKDYLTACSIAWDGNSLSSDNAVGATEMWIAESMVFTSNSERPHQPVRIYKKHIGRCGEHADLRAAVLRIGLIPATSILSISGDHTWNEFWDEEWIHYDGGSVNNPLLYENGWGKVFGSVFEIRSDGVLTPVTDTYSEGSATINIYVLDVNGNPIDGARIVLGVLNGTQVLGDNVGFTDREGKYSFIVGEARTYHARMTSALGNDPIDGSYLLLVENAEDGQEYTFSLNAQQAMPSIDFTEISPPEDTLADFQMSVEFSADKQVVHGDVVFDDTDDAEFYHKIDDASINFFMTDLIHYCSYVSGYSFETFYCAEAVDEGNFVFDMPVPEYGEWYAFFDNFTSLNNPQYIIGSISLYSYEIIYGDVNGDSVISSYDAALTLQFSAGIVNPDFQIEEAADVDGDDIISAYDAALVLQYSAGIIDEFPNGN